MSFDYSAPAAAAHRMLERFGRAITLVRVEAGDYDPDASAAATYEHQYAGIGAVFAYAQREMDGDQVRTGDQRLLLSADGVPTPQTGDKVVIGCDTWSVVRCETLAPAGVPVLHTVQLRGVRS